MNDHDQRWREIVENYGERVELDPEPEPEPDPHIEPDEPVHAVIPRPVDDPDRFDPERFVPPSPPPVRTPRGLRGAAWIGLFGVPALVLVLLLTSISIPSWLGLILLAWFIGGFGYLVATMPQNRSGYDGPDDGAVV